MKEGMRMGWKTRGFCRLAPAFALLALTLVVVGAQPWMKAEGYESPLAPTREFQGWSTMDEEGVLQLHMEAGKGFVVRGIAVDGKECEQMSGDEGKGQTDVYAKCGEGSKGAQYEGSVILEYEGGRAVGHFGGWRA